MSVLSDYFRAADVVVLPYVSATQSGVVQLAYRVWSPGDCIARRRPSRCGADEETGLLVPPGDPAALAAAIVRFFHDDMGPRMRASIAADQARFSWQRTGRNH